MTAPDEAIGLFGPGSVGWRVDRDERYIWPLTGVERRAIRFVPEAS